MPIFGLSQDAKKNVKRYSDFCDGDFGLANARRLGHRSHSQGRTPSSRFGAHKEGLSIAGPRAR
ncbi:hypothetical protein C8Q70DRAFT_1021063 [Cubamyces menziesii]|nr:hypothetical protein C8Q70DRAFT_1021063 [Cubamyces menziesii]